jgi:hypothetical protein
MESGGPARSRSPAPGDRLPDASFAWFLLFIAAVGLISGTLLWALTDSVKDATAATWTLLLYWLGGREALLAFGLFIMLAAILGSSSELRDAARRRTALALCIIEPPIAAALAWRWFSLHRHAIAAIAVLLALAGVRALLRFSRRGGASERAG